MDNFSKKGFETTQKSYTPTTATPTRPATPKTHVTVIYTHDGQEVREVVDVTTPRFVEVIGKYQTRVIPVSDDIVDKVGVIIKIKKLTYRADKKIKTIDVQYRIENGFVKIIGFKDVKVEGIKLSVQECEGHQLIHMSFAPEKVIASGDERLFTKRWVDVISNANMGLLADAKEEIEAQAIEDKG